MKHSTTREFTVTMNDAEARELEVVLYDAVKSHGSGGFTRSLYAYLQSRNERFPTDEFNWDMIGKNNPDW